LTGPTELREGDTIVEVRAYLDSAMVACTVLRDEYVS
jgi:hypothetical protein